MFFCYNSLLFFPLLEQILRVNWYIRFVFKKDMLSLNSTNIIKLFDDTSLIFYYQCRASYDRDSYELTLSLSDVHFTLVQWRTVDFFVSSFYFDYPRNQYRLFHSFLPPALPKRIKQVLEPVALSKTKSICNGCGWNMKLNNGLMICPREGFKCENDGRRNNSSLSWKKSTVVGQQWAAKGFSFLPADRDIKVETVSAKSTPQSSKANEASKHTYG
jgi:hypothetical protein